MISHSNKNFFRIHFDITYYPNGISDNISFVFQIGRKRNIHIYSFVLVSVVNVLNNVFIIFSCPQLQSLASSLFVKNSRRTVLIWISRAKFYTFPVFHSYGISNIDCFQHSIRTVRRNCNLISTINSYLPSLRICPPGVVSHTFANLLNYRGNLWMKPWELRLVANLAWPFEPPSITHRSWVRINIKEFFVLWLRLLVEF